MKSVWVFVSRAALLGMAAATSACSGYQAATPTSAAVPAASGIDERVSRLAAATPTSTLTAENSGLCVDVPGNSSQKRLGLQQYTCNSTPAQKFTFVVQSDGNYVIKTSSGLCLDSNGGGQVLQDQCWGNNYQEWSVQQQSNGEFLVRNAENGQCLNISGVSNSSGAQLITYACSFVNNELFKISTLSSAAPVLPTPTPIPAASVTSTTFVSQMTGKCLDAAGGSGSGLVQNPCSTSGDQSFVLAATSDGYVQLKSAKTGLCLSINAINSPVVSTSCAGVDSQKWLVTYSGDGLYVITSKSQGCFNIWGNSYNDGAPIYTYQCVASPNELFKASGLTAPVVTQQTAVGVFGGMQGQDMHAEAVKAFETWMGKSVSFAVEFGGAVSWSDYQGDISWASGIWKAKDPGRQIVWSIPLSTGPGCAGCGASLADIAAGVYDTEIKFAAQQLANNQPNAIIRLGWEFNGNWYPWSASGGRQQDYINAFRHTVAIYRSMSPKFTFMWCTNIGTNDFAPDTAYPGDDVVDVIAMDVYDFNWSNQDPTTRWQNMVNEDYGLRWQVYFANLHHKQMAVPEWGAGQSGDNPLFINNMAQWFKDKGYVYQGYWEAGDGSGFNAALETGAFPQEAAAFKANFGQ